MISRKNNKEDKRGRMKKLVGTVFLIGIICGSYTVAFAEQDIEMLLAQWFEKQRSESISKIEIAINKERDEQTNILKEQLQLEIHSAEVALEQFTNEEIEKRIEGIRAYAQQLKDSMEVDNSEERQKITEHIDRIYENAINDLSNVNVYPDNVQQNKEQEVNPPEESQDPEQDKVEYPPSPVEEEKQPGGPDQTIPIDPPVPVNPTQPEVEDPPAQN